MKKTKKKVLFLVFFAIFGVFFVAGVGFFVFGEQLAASGKFANGTTINGIDVSGLNQDEAQNLVATQLIGAREKVDITLRYKDRVWQFRGEDFEIDNQVVPQVESIFRYFNDGNLLQRKIKFNEVKNNKAFISFANLVLRARWELSCKSNISTMNDGGLSLVLKGDNSIVDKIIIC